MHLYKATILIVKFRNSKIGIFQKSFENIFLYIHENSPIGIIIRLIDFITFPIWYSAPLLTRFGWKINPVMIYCTQWQYSSSSFWHWQANQYSKWGTDGQEKREMTRERQGYRSIYCNNILILPILFLPSCNINFGILLAMYCQFSTRAISILNF